MLRQRKKFLECIGQIKKKKGFVEDYRKKLKLNFA